MLSLTDTKSNLVTSDSLCPSRATAHTLFVPTIAFFKFSISANADVVSDRKAGYRADAASIKTIAAAIGEEDYQTVPNQAKPISSCAQKIPLFSERRRLGRYQGTDQNIV